MNADLLTASLEELYEDAPCGFIFTLPDGSFARVNQTFLNWTGYTRAELAGIRLQALLTAPGRIFYENQYAPLLSMQGFVTGVSFDLRCADDRRLPVLLNSTLRLAEDGEPALIASTIFDATERERYERDLRAARQRAEQLAAIVTSASDAIVGADADGLIATWNRGAEHLFGYLATEQVGQSLWSLLPSLRQDVKRQEVMRELHAGQPVYLDGAGLHANGQALDVSIGLMPTVGHLGELTSIAAIMRDISQRRAVERLQQEFLAITGHELRHPLTNIRGQAQLMQRRERYSDRAVESIIEQVDRLGRLVDDLLLASLVEADRFDVRREPLDLAREVALAVEQHQSPEHPLDYIAPDVPLLVLGDRQRLGQVFANLLSNAGKYSPSGAEITVRAHAEPDAAVVTIADRGFGIPAEDLPRLFARFYRANSTARGVQGLGLGLYISHRIVQAHGGSLTVTSELGTGSTFTVSLPSVPSVT